ncbi:hypothetical protein T439DRAFT_329849, partial [Meredithblackwellia eburnea MCA 4105]
MPPKRNTKSKPQPTPSSSRYDQLDIPVDPGLFTDIDHSPAHPASSSATVIGVPSGTGAGAGTETGTGTGTGTGTASALDSLSNNRLNQSSSSARHSPAPSQSHSHAGDIPTNDPSDIDLAILNSLAENIAGTSSTGAKVGAGSGNGDEPDELDDDDEERNAAIERQVQNAVKAQLDDQVRRQAMEIRNTWNVEGMRFCSGCRANKPNEDFVEGRKMCWRHRKPKRKEDLPPTPQAIPTLSTLLAQSSQLTGCARFEGTCRISEVPGQEIVERELNAPHPFKSENYDPDAGLTEEVENMRRARARARPLVEWVQKCTGYNFIYKDCRSGRRLKYAHSLRFLCAQREDQDTTKRRSQEKKKMEDAKLAELNTMPTD